MTGATLGAWEAKVADKEDAERIRAIELEKNELSTPVSPKAGKLDSQTNNESLTQLVPASLEVLLFVLLCKAGFRERSNTSRIALFPSESGRSGRPCGLALCGLQRMAFSLEVVPFGSEFADRKTLRWR